MIMKALRSKYSATQISNHVIKKQSKTEEPEYKNSKYPARLFDPNGDMSSFSMAILGSSGSGKTTLMSNELNKMNPGEYDFIILMTESKNAAPLQHINLNIMVIEGYDEHKIKKLKDINDKSNNLFRFLVILDDIIDQKYSKDLNKSLMVYRNSNISTVICCQYPQILSKMARGSVHYVVINGFRSLEDWENISKIYDLTHWAAEKMGQSITTKKYIVYKWLKDQLSDPLKIIFINQKLGKEPIIHLL
jgi:molybdopterin-guanine dinucleotide biosynthesis protein